ncbi:hypothetical protein BH09BAC5_BH09BAC5_11420 [soil metagenome]
MKVILPIKLLNIEGDGYHLQIKIKINGKNANAIIDTGASKTVFDKTRIEKFLKKEKITEHDRMSTGLGTASMQSHVVELKKLSIGKLDIPDYNGVVLDLSHVNQTYSAIGLSPIDAVLGSDIMEQYKAIIDFNKKTLSLTFSPIKKSGKKKVVKKQVKKK